MNQDKPMNKLAKGSYFLILDSLANLGIGAVFWLVLAKLTDPTVLGQAMVVWTFAVTILGFTGYGIQVALSKYLSEYNAKNMPNTVRRLLRNGIRASFIMSAAAALVICLLSDQIATLGYKDPTLSVLIIFTIATFLPTQTIIAALLGAFTGLHTMKYVTITDAIFQAVKMVFAIAAILSGLGVFGILMGFTIASFISLAVSYFYLLPRAIPKSTEIEEKLEGTKHITRFASLSYLTVGFNMMSHHLGILVLGAYSFEWAAFYGLALLISKVVGSFSHSVGSALLPTASEQWAKGDKVQLGKMVNTAVRISILISGFGFIILMMDPSYFLSLISDSYIEAGWSLRILATSGIMAAISMILTSLLNAANRAADVARIGIISSATITILTFVLAHSYGIEGAAMAVFIGFALRLTLSSVVLKQKEKMMISSRSIIKPFVAIMGGLMVGYVFVIWNQVLVGVLVGIGCYVIFAITYKVTTKHEIRQIIRIAISHNKK
jgi:O-antigen/teichoic acid export membrane protein